MEAASVAWHPLGFKPVGFSEIEPFPCAILSTRYPNTPNYGSLTEFNTWPLATGDVDLLCGGTPCQSFSVAGKRGGLNDPRGQLMFSFLGLAEKLGKPRWIVWENVPGCLSSGQPKGSDFGCFLQGLVELGYGFAYRILDAQHFGVPQRRRRVFVVACLGDWRAAAEVLSLREGLRGYLETGNKKRKSPAADAGASAQAGRKWPADVACTLNAHFGDKQGLEDQHALGGGSLFVPGQTIGTLCARDYKGVGNQYVQEGKCIPCPAPQPFRKSKRACSTTDNETWVPADASNTLNNFDLGDTRTTHAVVQPIPIQDGREMEKKQNGLGIANQGDPAYTIDTTGAQAIAIQGTIIGRSENADPQGTGASEGGPMFTLTKTDIHGVSQNMAVRRLTPVECERLQGFPDNWSRISWKGKPEEQCPDGPRYKACGNSMAVPVMAFIGRQIAAVDATL